MDIIRQGDVMLLEVKELPKSAKEVKPVNGSFVLALGEATGHHHRFEQTENVRCFVSNDNNIERRFYVIENRLFIEHEEHAPLEVEKPLYEQIYQYESSDDDEPVPVVD
jgi:hypothetical protein